MKRILVFIPYLGIGGTTSSLSAFLENVDPDFLQVDVFARKRYGDFLTRLDNCTILPENVFLSSDLYNANKVKRLFCRGLHLANHALSKLGLSLYPLTCRIGGRQMRTQDYDAIVSYQESLSGFISYLPAKKRIAWIRSEYERFLKVGGSRDETKVYKKIDTVVAVSDFAKGAFLKIHPWHPDVITINNFMNVENVRKLSKDKSQIHEWFKKGDFTILSVGRISPVKQFEKIPEILFEVRRCTNKDVRWYIVGGARGFEKIERKLNADVEKYGLQQALKVLPETSNPFAYMAEADLFVHTSASETYSRVVAESKSVGTPVVVNNYAAAYEFVKNGEDGLIVPMDKMAGEIANLINDEDRYRYFRQNLKVFSWPNDVFMEKTIEIL